AAGVLSVGTTSTNTAGLGCRVNIRYLGGAGLYGMGFQPDNNSTTILVFANAAGSGAGSITLGTTTVAYNTSSDRRLKKNIKDAGDPWGIVNGLRVRSFDWKGYSDGEDHFDFGLIAQEAAEVFELPVSIGDDQTTA